MIVQEGMDLLSRRQYSELARQFQVSLRQIQPAVKFISDNLNPFPARSHWGDVRQPTSANLQVYHRPDIIISHQNENENGPLVVEIIMPLAGTLRVNPLFKEAVRETSDEKREAWKGDLERASLFVKCIQQRNHTMQRLLQRVVSIQKEFIIKGDKYLKPITRASFSRELDVHESTISRAVANKTVQLPNRKIIPMANFFDRSLNVRTVLKDIISSEPHPLSDTELTCLLEKSGFSVARRTVAKYRAMEGILPAHLRHVGSSIMTNLAASPPARSSIWRGKNPILADLGTVLDHITDAALIIERSHSGILFVNHALTTLSTYSTADLANHPLQELIPEIIEQPLEMGAEKMIRLVRKSRTPIEVNAKLSPLDSAGNWAVVTFTPRPTSITAKLA